MPESAPSPAPSLPPIDRDAVQSTFLSVLMKPAEFFRSVKSEPGFGKAFVFSVVMGVLYGVLLAVSALILTHSFGAAIFALVMGAISGAIGPFIGGAIVFVICMLLGSKAPFENSVRVAGYSGAIMPIYGVAMIVTVVPFVGWLARLAAGLYGLYVVFIGAREVNFDAPAALPPAPPPPPPAS